MEQNRSMRSSKRSCTTILPYRQHFGMVFKVISRAHIVRRLWWLLWLIEELQLKRLLLFPALSAQMSCSLKVLAGIDSRRWYVWNLFKCLAHWHAGIVVVMVVMGIKSHPPAVAAVVVHIYYKLSVVYQCCSLASGHHQHTAFVVVATCNRACRGQICSNQSIGALMDCGQFKPCLSISILMAKAFVWSADESRPLSQWISVICSWANKIDGSQFMSKLWCVEGLPTFFSI